MKSNRSSVVAGRADVCPSKATSQTGPGSCQMRGRASQEHGETGASAAGTLGPRPPTWHRDLSASAPARRPLPTGGCVSRCCRSPACCADTPAHLGGHRGTKGTREYPPLSAIAQGVLLPARPLIHSGRAVGIFYSPIPRVFTD